MNAYPFRSAPLASPSRPPWLCVLLAALLGACSPETPPPAKIAVPVHTLKVGPQSQAGQINWSGEVRARFETPLAFRVPGKIIERPAQIGDLVKRGQLLARLDPEDLNLQKLAVGAQIAAAQTELAQQLDDLERYRSLLERGFISQAEFDRRRNTAEIARARVAELRSHHSSSRNQAAYTALNADEDGVITAVDAERGQVVAAGQPIVRIAQLKEKDIVITVPENRVADLRQARELTIGLWSRPDHTYHGKLREVSPIADPGTRTYMAKIAVLDPDEEMRLGMTARVQAATEYASRLVVPLSALYRKENRTAVWVVDPASRTVRLVPVQADALHGDQAAITAGLGGGEIVVTAGVHKLHEGQAVRMVETTP